MNSSYEGFDFTGGWQDECAEDVVSELYAARPRHENAQQLSAATLEDDGTTANPHWALPSTCADYYHICGPSLSTSLPGYTTSGLDWNNNFSFTGVSDLDLLPSSFSESDVDYYQAYTIEGQAQSLPIMPTYNPYAIKPEAIPTTISQSPTYQTDALATTVRFGTPPNLYQCTLQHPTSPPLNDFDPADPLHPRAQAPRFDADLYTPTFVRGAGCTRSGWCGYCATWHTLKDSAYWYHMHFAHGISCATGARLPDPLRFRNITGAARGVGDWEAQCGGCARWVLVIEGEKGRTAWFRHAYKCLLKGASGPGGLGRQRSGGGRAKSRSPRKVAVRPTL